MAEQGGEPRPFRDTFVVDADVHGAFQSEGLKRRLGARMPEPWASVLTDDVAYPSTGLPRTWGGRLHEHYDTEDPETDIHEELCVKQGIDHPIINILTVLDEVRGLDRAVAEMRATNDVLLEHYLDGYDAFYGLCTITTRKPETAAEELDRMGAEDQIKGVLVMPGQAYQKPLGDPSYDMIYRAAEDNDLTVTYHAADETLARRGATLLQDFETMLPIHTIGFPWSLMLTLTSLIVEGVPEKFPGLRFVFTEAGVGWAGYMIGRLNQQVAWRPLEAPLLEKTPEEYIRDRFYFGTQPLEEYNDPAVLEWALRIVGAESLLFCSDWPHWDFDTLEHADAVFRRAFTEAERERVLSANAIEAYNLEG